MLDTKFNSLTAVKKSEGCNVAYLKLKSFALKRMSCYGYSSNLEKDMNDKLRL
jgi:hypothetical protein